MTKHPKKQAVVNLFLAVNWIQRSIEFTTENGWSESNLMSIRV